jgi:hypothetical protein
MPAGLVLTASLGVLLATTHVPAAAAQAPQGKPLLPTTKTVTNTNDKGAGSLRAAIFKANNPTLNVDTIEFDIPGAGPHVIEAQSALPALTAPVTIDGYSQPGTSRATDSQNAVLDIVITYPVTVVGTGLRIRTDDSVVTGLVVKKASGDGIAVTGNGNTLTGNYVGTNATGELRAGNGGDGISLVGDENTIGGITDGDRNLISNNGAAGVRISGQGNTVEGNRIGTDVDGESERGNLTSGVEVDSGSANVIGGASNLISGNGGPGVSVGADAGADVVANLIGTDLSGVVDLGNGEDGVFLDSDGNFVSLNVIGGNEGDGIHVEASQTLMLENQVGVSGTPPVTAIPNEGDGIYVKGDGATIGDVDAGNTIAANGGNGVRLLGDDEVVASNFIGTDPVGTLSLGNGLEGVFLTGSGSYIGGEAPEFGNVVSGNLRNGVHVVAPGGAHQHVNDFVVYNLIGTDPVGTGQNSNSVNGVLLNASLVQVRSNTIWWNGAAGVEVFDGTDNPITSNSINLNADLGIDLVPLGVTPNDRFDPDAGPNDLVNFPFVQSATSNAAGTFVVWQVRRSLPNTMMQLEFFASDACNAGPQNGEGTTPLGTVVTTTDANGNATGGNQLSVGSVVGQVATATATLVPIDARPTSEFSPCTTVS